MSLTTVEGQAPCRICGEQLVCLEASKHGIAMYCGGCHAPPESPEEVLRVSYIGTLHKSAEEALIAWDEHQAKNTDRERGPLDFTNAELKQIRESKNQETLFGSEGEIHRERYD